MARIVRTYHVLLTVILFISCTEFIPEPTQPEKVTLLVPGTVYASAVVISWTKLTSKNFSAYNLYYDTKSGITESSSLAASIFYKHDTTCLLHGLEDNTTYYAKVFVFNSNAYSESNEIMFTTEQCTCGVFTGEKQNGMVRIPAGCFIGKDTSIAAISRDFYMDTTEVTEGGWNRVMREADMDTTQFTKEEWEIILSIDTSISLKPKVNITWLQMIQYCNERSKQYEKDTCYTYTSMRVDTNTLQIDDLTDLQCCFTENGFRLPTEDEWEYAYRCGRLEEYYWGKDGNTSQVFPYTATYPMTAGDSLEISEYAWWEKSDNPEGVEEVAQKKLNAWHLYDMAGNALEFVWDIPSSVREKSRIDYTGPEKGPQSPSARILRGGYYSSRNYQLTAWWRLYAFAIDIGKESMGFRTVHTDIP